MSQDETDTNVEQLEVHNEEYELDQNDEDDIFDENEERFVREAREGLDLNVQNVTGKINFCISVEEIISQKKQLEEKREGLKDTSNTDPINYHAIKNIINRQLDDLDYKSKRLEQRLKESKIVTEKDFNRILAVKEIWMLNYNDRWILYRYRKFVFI